MISLDIRASELGELDQEITFHRERSEPNNQWHTRCCLAKLRKAWEERAKRKPGAGIPMTLATPNPNLQSLT